MDSESPLLRLTIITVCLNAENTLWRTLDSIALQTHSSIELILCDGGSKDQTKAVFEQWAGDHASKFFRVHWFDQQSVGIYTAMNEAAAQATGEVITFLHANDAFDHAHVCELAMNELSLNNQIQAVFGDVRVESEHWWKRRFIASRWWRPWMLRWGFMSSQPGFFVRLNAFQSVGPFIETMRIAADFEWLLRFHFRCNFQSLWIDGIQINMLSGGISMRGKDSRSIITKEIEQSLNLHGYSVHAWRLWLRLPLKGFGIIRAIWR